LLPKVVGCLLGRIVPFKSIEHDVEVKSIQEAYDYCHSGGWELPPEFYFSPACVSGDSFRLPDWSHNNADEFVYMHRKFLESDCVSKGLAHWIDCLF
jgi:hypothetical protein